MAAPDFKNGKLQLVSGFSVSDRVSMSCWLNITDQALIEAVMAFYHSTGERPGFSMQKKVNDRFEDVAKAKMFNDVLDPYEGQKQQPQQQPAPQGFQAQEPAPQQPAQGFQQPQGGFSYQQAKNG